MDRKYFLGKTITSIAAVLALGVVALPAHASNTTAEFAQQLDQSDGVKSSDALWTNTADGSSSRAVSSPPYGNDSAVSVPGSSSSAGDAARAAASRHRVVAATGNHAERRYNQCTCSHA
jgi:hypothetical protein